MPAPQISTDALHDGCTTLAAVGPNSQHRCDGTSTYHKQDKRAFCAESLTQNQAAIKYFEAAIVVFNSPAVERIVMMAIWVETIFPPSAWSSSVPASAIGAWAVPRCRSHSYGNDTVGLLNLGCSKGDRRITLAGRKYYLATIQALQSDIAQPSWNTLGIFAASLDLMMSSLYAVVSPGVDTWLHHLTGQTTLLSTRSTECTTPGFSSFIVSHYRQLNLIRGLVFRKSMPPGSWDTGLDEPSQGSSELMCRLAIKLPALLELTDQTMKANERNDDESVRVLVSLLQLERSLSDWLETWTDLQPSRKQLASTRSHNTTQTIPSFEDSLVIGMLWCLLLLLHESVYDLTRRLGSKIYNTTRKASFDKADTYAMLLYQSVPHLLEQAGEPLSKILAVRAPLHFAECWYNRVRDEEQVERCRAHEKSLRESAPHLDWDIALFWSFLSANWLIDDKVHTIASSR